VFLSKFITNSLTILGTEIFRKYSPKTLVVLEGVIPLETFPLVEWH
jgi:hypothetical protein